MGVYVIYMEEGFTYVSTIVRENTDILLTNVVVSISIKVTLCEMPAI